jgi:cold shock CspA family protein
LNRSPRCLTSAPHEGCVDWRGYHPERAFVFLIDWKERRQYFAHASNIEDAIFAQLIPGVRVAFDVYERRGRLQARAVRLL